MNEITTIGLDLAKNVFHVICTDSRGKVLRKKMLKRSQMLSFFAQIPSALVGMEACASAHYWARELRALGHDVKLIAPQYVKAFLHGNKNDFNDAQAIAEAVTRSSMRFVQIKTVEQEDIQALHRLRELSQKTRTALNNQLRGLLAQGYQQLLTADEEIAFYTRELNRQSQQNDARRRLQTIPGVGPALETGATVRCPSPGNYASYARCIKSEKISNGKYKGQGNGKNGNKYLAWAFMEAAHYSAIWNPRIKQYYQRKQAKAHLLAAKKAVANKLARACYHMLKRQEPFDVKRAFGYLTGGG